MHLKINMKFLPVIINVIFLFCFKVQGLTKDFVEWRSLFSEKQLRILFQNKIPSLYQATDFKLPPETSHGFISDAGLSRNRRWTNRIVYYHIMQDFASVEETVIKSAMQSISYATNSCISFIELEQSNHNVDHIVFVRSESDCYSYVGCVGGAQRIVLKHDCIATRGLVEHELMHALGFYHEHQRRDRDSYISVKLHNVKQVFRERFAIIPHMETFNLPYDFESITHYPANAFIIRNQTSISDLHLSIVPHPSYAGKVPVVQAPTLSRLDVERIKRAYCPEQLTTASTSSMKTSDNKDNDNGTAAMETTRRPEDSSDDYPVFNSSPMTARECDAIFNNKCSATNHTRTSCVGQTKDIEIRCWLWAKSDDVHQLTSLLASFSPSRSYRFIIEDGPLFSKHGFDKLRRQITTMKLFRCKSPQTLSKLPDIGLMNLLDLNVQSCKDLQIRKDDFSKNSRLRALLFYWTTIADIEKGTFMNLPDLKLLSLEYNADLTKPLTSEQSAHIYQFHCGCEYKWLREWFKWNPVVISPKEEGEIYVLPDRKSSSFTRTEIFIPIDCLEPQSDRPILNYNQVTYSVNDNCRS